MALHDAKMPVLNPASICTMICFMILVSIFGKTQFHMVLLTLRFFISRASTSLHNCKFLKLTRPVRMSIGRWHTFYHVTIEYRTSILIFDRWK